MAEVAIFWFRNDLRTQDNAALRELRELGYQCLPVHIIDRPMSDLQMSLQLECLSSLRASLGEIHVFQTTKPYQLLRRLLCERKASIAYNEDPEYYARDQKHFAKETVICQKGGDLLADHYPSPSSFTKARTWVLRDKQSRVPAVRKLVIYRDANIRKEANYYRLPKHSGPDIRQEAWKRLRAFRDQVPGFSKPETSPNALVPETSMLSRYLARGCLGVREVWHKVEQIDSSLATDQRSFLGQLIWREYYRLLAYQDPHFHQQRGNLYSKDLNYSYARNAHFRAWKAGLTGYPFVDACMRQLRQEGWIHHLARHMVACFLTRGDLYLHWELGQSVFDEYLIDRDYAINAGNWMWVSASAFFHQYYRIYSPISFGKKTDPSGEYIRKYVPCLADYPDKYIYQPWEAPAQVQKDAKCIIGRDYPIPIVDHAVVSKRNVERIKRQNH